MTEHEAPHEAPHEVPGGAGPAAGRVVARAGQRGAAAGSDWTDRVVSWIGWHLGELAGVGVPAVLAVTAHPMWVVPATLVAAGWLVHETRQRRRSARAGQAGGLDLASESVAHGEPMPGGTARDAGSRDVAPGDQGWTA